MPHLLDYLSRERIGQRRQVVGWDGRRRFGRIAPALEPLVRGAGTNAGYLCQVANGDIVMPCAVSRQVAQGFQKCAWSTPARPVAGWAENAVFDGIDDALAELHKAGVTLALATSKNEMFAHRILEHFGLADYFTVIAGATTDGSRQSKADVIAHALAGTGHAPTAAARGGTSGVVIVGDRVHDVEGAAVWGIPAVFVEWGYGPAAERAGARWTVSTVEEMSSLLRTITSESIRVDDGRSIS